MNASLFAPAIVNGYVWDKIAELDQEFVARYRQGILPFFPVYDNKSGREKWGTVPYVVYDVAVMRRKSPLYAVKCESMLMSIRGTVQDVLYLRDVINYVIDRQDDAAKDINEWAGANVNNCRIFFHWFATSEQNWSSEITEVQDTRQQITKDLIVEYDYHIINM